MLLRFSVANHLSMRDPQELSLSASSLTDVEAGLIDCAAVPSGRVLPAVVIYGANASGKSNFVAALGYMCSAVLHSHSKGAPGGGVPRTPFALDPTCVEAASIFVADFVVDGVRYHYGFEASDETFDAEWLYAFPNNRRQMLFERKSESFSFGRGLKGRNKVIADLTRPNSLFLSAAAQNDHKQLSRVVRFFRALRIDSRIVVPGEIASLRLAQEEVDGRVIKFLDKIGTGVIDYRRREREVPDEIQALQRELVSAFRRVTKGQVEIRPGEDEKDIAIELAHRGHDGKAIFFDLDRESAGTRRLLILLGRVFRVLDEGALLLIDELDASLHTQACEAMLALFSSHTTNPNGAQMVATTHDTNLLRSPLLRRDQIWFTEKDAEGATHLYPLTDIRTRKGDDLEKGYLQGRYGAIPFSGPISDVAAE
jgi:predicted ATPase